MRYSRFLRQGFVLISTDNKKYLLYGVFLSLLLILAGCSGMNDSPGPETALEPFETMQCNGVLVTSQTPNTQIPGLVTSEHMLYPLHCTEQVLKEMLSTSDKPVVLFVHGRGQHPSKAVKKDNLLIQNIEQQYGVEVVLFTWPSWRGSRHFPEDEATEAGPALNSLLQALATVKKKDNPSRVYTLLTHSMGSLVLEGLIQTNLKPLPRDLFESIVISSSASALASHSTWVNKLEISPQIYVLTNKQDKVLQCLEDDVNWFSSLMYCDSFEAMQKRLGRWGADIDSNTSTGSHTLYFDFSPLLDDDHRYYINQAKKAPAVHLFYDNIFHGKPVGFTAYEEVLPDKIFRITQ